MGICEQCKGTGALPGEPPVGSVVIDGDGDAWQCRYNGWSCVVHDVDFESVPWADLVRRHQYERTVYTP